MSTGDLKNNIKKLQTQLKSIKYSGKLDLEGIRDGSPTAFLPLFHYVFTSYSSRLNKDISNSNNELYGKSDLRFIEAVYKILRDMFSYKPPVTREQFFQSGFAERKVIMATEIFRHIHSSYNPPASGSSYKLASKLDKKQQDIHAKIQSNVAGNHKAPRKVAGKSAADLTEAIVLPRYMTSSSASSLSHDHRDSSRPAGPTIPATELSDSDSPSHHSRTKPPRTRVSVEADPMATQFTQHITNALTMLNTQVSKISTALEKVETQIASNESPRTRQTAPRPVSTALPDKLQMETLVSKVILLENRMTLLENKVDDIQAFCTILLEDRTNNSNTNNNNNSNNVNSHSHGISNNRDDDKPLTTPIRDVAEVSSVNERIVHQPADSNRRMHPDYVKAFAPVADIVGMSSIVGGGDDSRHNDRMAKRVSAADDDGCDADDDVTIENVAVRKDQNDEDVVHQDSGGQTGHLKFMKALIGPNDSEISLPQDQDVSTALLTLQHQELHAHTQSNRHAHAENNPNTRTRNSQNSHIREPISKGSSHPPVSDTSFGNAFSPIRGIRDSFLMGQEDNSVIHIPYGLEDGGPEPRRLSSTPNKGDDLDTSTLSRVNRIMQMMRETQEHFQQNS